MEVDQNKPQGPKRKIYHVLIAFDQPVEGSLSVAANDMGHATELVLSQMAERKNLRIVDVCALEDIEQLGVPSEAADKPLIEPQKIN